MKKKITTLPNKIPPTKDTADSKIGVKTYRLSRNRKERNSHFTKEPESPRIIKWKL